MKVCDLFEKLEKEMPDVKTSKKEFLKAHYATSKKWDKLGSPGSQAAAYVHTEKGTVVKAINIRGPSDPVYQFVRMARRHQDNPYFPKIYSIKLYPLTDVYRGTRPNQPTHKMMITTEKLFHIGPAMYPLLEKIFHIKFDNQQDYDAMCKQLKYRHFSTTAWRRELMNKTQDPKLKQALRLMEPLFRHYQPDMHLGNVMIRRTGGIPQLVIADPVV